MTGSGTVRQLGALLSALLLSGGVYSACAETSVPTALPAETTSAAPAAQPHTWPRVFQEGAETVTMYQPQIEKWDDTSITFRAAIAIESAGSTEPIYGMVRTTAQADVDKVAGMVTLHDFQIVKVLFPTAPEREAGYQAILSRHLPAGAKEVALDRLEASAAVSLAVKKQRGLGVNNDPPQIIFSTSPALLVLVDGDPLLRPLPGTDAADLERVINTRALIVETGGQFYLSVLNFCYAAQAIEGPWHAVKPAYFIGQARQLAGDQVDLMEPEAGATVPETEPALYVSTVPAELIQTDGEPQFIPIPGTGLLQAQNSDDAIFLDGQTGKYYVLISGRWFSAVSLDRGPWQFVPARELPPDFARIPQDSPRANVLVSVPGTPEAQEALIADAIPQTATVTPGPADVNLAYDGPPQFEPVEGVPDLQYAENASLPVLCTAPDSFYCVQNGIWLVAPTPTGPWVVATAVPPAIYSIPPSCPDYYVTYCRIYGFTPEAVYVGYTPGYLGAIVSADGVVVYGSGWRYRRHIGQVWIPEPCTYGFGAGFACGPDTGFSFGFSAGLLIGARPEPYWGPYDWGRRHHFNYGQVSLNHADLYEHWSGKVVANAQRRADEEKNARIAEAPFNPYSARKAVQETRANVPPPPRATSAPAGLPQQAQAEKPPKLNWSANTKPRTLPSAQEKEEAAAQAAQRAAAAKPNNVFVSVSGDVYRRTPAPAPKPAIKAEPITRPESTVRAEPVQVPRETPTPARQPAQPAQWEQRTPAGWKPAAESPAFRQAAPELNREAAARDIGEARAVSRPAMPEVQIHNPIAPSRPSEPSRPEPSAPGGMLRR